MQETWVRSLGWEDPLEESMATHSRVLTWRSPWTEEPGGLQSMRSQRAGHGWGDLAFTCAEGWTNRALSRWLAGGSSVLISVATIIIITTIFDCLSCVDTGFCVFSHKLAHYTSWAKFSWLSIFVNKVLSEHSHAWLCMYCRCLSLFCSGTVELW